jgi:acetyl-CoA carboxylase biotin carboxylase subunit
MMKKIKKILIANRGEIAVRVIRTCQDLGIETVAVYADGDEGMLAVKLADEAFPLSGETATETYLDVDKVLQIAKSAKVDAVHPGYGFLSENTNFAKACEKAGITFIGPSPESISRMGDKISARQIAEKAGVPMASGDMKPVKDEKSLKETASQIGFPLLIKATAGGGGKGMRIVKSEEDLVNAWQRASSEALKSFGNGDVYVEKFITKPRHIEVQIIADQYGDVKFLGERECSVQRRYQKIIEESPCPDLKSEVREKMAEAAISLAKSVDYEGVGTVEFLIDDKQNFYFLEMNTRLQVEHTVTEEVWGVDLVALQVFVAQGENLSALIPNVFPRGHAIQCRVYAEDPDSGFMPSPGTVLYSDWPQGSGVRVDTGFEKAFEVSASFDPMISKLISYASTRAEAIKCMARMLHETSILGVKTNLKFLHDVLLSKEFQNSTFTTNLLDQRDTAEFTLPEKEISEDIKKFILDLMSDSSCQNSKSSPVESKWWQEGQTSWRDS